MSLTRAPISHFSLQSHKLAPAVHPVSCVRLIALKLPSIHEALRLLHFRGDPDLGRREGHATQVHSASFPRRGRVANNRTRIHKRSEVGVFPFELERDVTYHLGRRKSSWWPSGDLKFGLPGKMTVTRTVTSSNVTVSSPLASPIHAADSDAGYYVIVF